MLGCSVATCTCRGGSKASQSAVPARWTGKESRGEEAQTGGELAWLRVAGGRRWQVAGGRYLELWLFSGSLGL